MSDLERVREQHHAPGYDPYWCIHYPDDCSWNAHLKEDAEREERWQRQLEGKDKLLDEVRNTLTEYGYDMGKAERLEAELAELRERLNSDERVAARNEELSGLVEELAELRKAVRAKVAEILAVAEQGYPRQGASYEYLKHALGKLIEEKP